MTEDIYSVDRKESTGKKRIHLYRSKTVKDNHIVLAVNLKNKSDDEMVRKEIQKTIIRLNRLLEGGMSHTTTYL